MEPILFAVLFRFAPWLLLGVAAFVFSRSAIGRALAERLRTGAVANADFAALAAEVDELRRELGEVHERLDFTERLLAHQRDELPPPRPEDHSPFPPEPAVAGGR